MKRNDRCACGSGKKFKQCCMPRGEDTGYHTKDEEKRIDGHLSAIIIAQRPQSMIKNGWGKL